MLAHGGRNSYNRAATAPRESVRKQYDTPAGDRGLDHTFKGHSGLVLEV